MVEDRITDGKRIAQLLASELSGLETGPLDRVSVVDADRDAEPSPDGTFAYGVALDGDRVGTVFVHETTARLDLTVDGGADDEQVGAADDRQGLDVETTADGLRLHVAHGGAVKRAVDLLAALVDEE